MGLGTTVPTWYSAGMGKMAENCGGRYPARTDDLLGVNDRATRQIRHLAQTPTGCFADKGAFSSVSVPVHGTERTNVEDLRDAVETLGFGGPHPSTWDWKRPPANHLVYFVGGDDGPVKIGFTQQPIKARLVCIQNGSPIKLRVLATVNATRNCERLYHKQFAAHRLHGEWFERSPEILAEIERLKA